MRSEARSHRADATMRWPATLLTLALFAPTAAQEYPVPTEVGRKALGEMV
jgi:hypothetical protein